jgi:hypothetical protein
MRMSRQRSHPLLPRTAHRCLSRSFGAASQGVANKERRVRRHSRSPGAVIVIGGQKIQVGLHHVRKTAEVIVEAATRALRHIQRRRASELVSA